MVSLADRIMRAAAHGAPKGQTAWVDAMQAEYAELNHGRLTWALGCWLAVTRWRLQEDAGYFAALGLVAIILPMGWPAAYITLLGKLLLWTPSWSFYALWMLGPALSSFALGAYRPRRIMLTVAAIQISELAFAWISFAHIGHSFQTLWDMIERLHIMNQPFTLGLSVWVAADLICAWLGGRVRHKLALAR